MVVSPLLRVLLIWIYMNLISWAVVGWIIADHWSSVWMIILMVINLLPAGVFYDSPAPPRRAYPSPL